MDCGQKSIEVDGITFTQVPVKLVKPVPRIGKQLIGFDDTFQVNRLPVDCSAKIEEIYTLLCENYPVIDKSTQCDFYIPAIDLYIDLRLDQYSNFNAYCPTNKYHKNCLNQLIEVGDIEFIRRWCIQDYNKRKSMIGKKYLEIFEYETEEDLFNQVDRAVFGLCYDISEDTMIWNAKNILTTEPRYSSSVINNQIIQNFQPHFVEIENEVYADPLKRRDMLENTRFFNYKRECEQTDADILMNFRFSKKYCIPFSYFSPFWIKKFIADFGVKYIYDPCGGWGQRFLGSWDINYIYNDIDPRSVNGVKNIATFVGEHFPNSLTKKFYCQDASEFTPEESYDCVFTCPPYFDREVYTAKNTSTSRYSDYENWLNIWWGGVISSSVKEGVKYFAYIIDGSHKDKMNEVCIKKGLKFVVETPIGTKVENHYIRNKSGKSNKEFLQIFEV